MYFLCIKKTIGYPTMHRSSKINYATANERAATGFSPSKVRITKSPIRGFLQECSFMNTYLLPNTVSFCFIELDHLLQNFHFQ